MTTAAFVLTWFVFIPYLASNPHIDLTATMAESGSAEELARLAVTYLGDHGS
jgi:hypothetical protein